MNTLTFKIRPLFAVALAAIFALSACNSPKKLAKALDKMKFKTQPEVLEVKGDSVEVKVNGKIPAKTFGKKAVVKFQPVLVYGDEQKELDALYLQGEKVKEKKGKVIKYAKGGGFTYDKKIEYTPEMKKARLSLEYQIKVASNYDELNQCYSGKRDSSTRGTIVTALFVKPYDDIYFYTGNEHPNLYDTTMGGQSGRMQSMETAGKPNMVFYYVINEGSLRDSAKRGPAARLLAKIVGPKETKTAKVKGKKGQKDMAADEKELKEEMSKGGKVTGVVFKSFASPDGEINHNAQLCQQRAASSYDFVKKEFKRLDVKEINDANFVKQPDANEDWAGFKTLVERSNMKGKQDVLAVINSNASVDDKEKQLRSMTSVWNDLAKNILPRLRRTEVYLQGLGSVTVRSSAPRTAEELSSAHQQGADSTISQREMLILAASIKDINEREKIYKMYTDKYPNDWTGQNNYAAIILQEGGSMVNSDATAMKSNPKIDQALGMFDRLHTQYPTNDTITSNLAVAKRFSRKYEDAQTGYATAKTDGVKESNNMGILYIKYGFYDKAVTSFDAGQCDYNVALAYTLKGELDQALTKIDCITDKKSEDFYLKAIIGARKQDKTLMSTALTRAVQMDPSLRDRAKNDLEFMKYWTAPEFTNAIK